MTSWQLAYLVAAVLLAPHLSKTVGQFGGALFMLLSLALVVFAK